MTVSVGGQTNGLKALNAMLGSWGANRLLVYEVTSENFPLVVGTGSYTIGSGGAFNTVRPNKITDAYLRDGTTDTPLHIDVRNRYNEISDKTAKGLPNTLYYLQEYPLGKILFDYVPDKTYTLFLDSWKTLSTLAAVGTTVNLPPEYERALIYNLAIELAPEYDAVLLKEVYAIAEESREALAGVNSQSVEESVFDSAIISRGRRRNIVTDRFD